MFAWGQGGAGRCSWPRSEGPGGFEAESRGTAGPCEGLDTMRQSPWVHFLHGGFGQWKRRCMGLRDRRGDLPSDPMGCLPRSSELCTEKVWTFLEGHKVFRWHCGRVICGKMVSTPEPPGNYFCCHFKVIFKILCGHKKSLNHFNSGRDVSHCAGAPLRKQQSERQYTSGESIQTL